MSVRKMCTVLDLNGCVRLTSNEHNSGGECVYFAEAEKLFLVNENIIIVQRLN